ncbi:hypothetical protein LVW03_20065, partial [Klebsiella pneumoniae]|nr:hypothetical protein [Klebsiella pneumoniae]
KHAYCLKTQPATGETYPKSDLFNKADVMTTHPDLFFNESEVKPAEPQPDEGEPLSPLDF